jgi:hypothetical protein
MAFDGILLVGGALAGIGLDPWAARLTGVFPANP